VYTVAFLRGASAVFSQRDRLAPSLREAFANAERLVEKGSPQVERLAWVRGDVKVPKVTAKHFSNNLLA
jgi:hypothetical protein